MADKSVYRVRSIAEFHEMKGLPAPEHPHISFFDYSKVMCSKEVNHKKLVFDFYNISCKRSIDATFKYGEGTYDFSKGVMFYIAPNQVFSIEPIADIATPKSGWVLLVHPDFMWDTGLAAKIRKFVFFKYAVNEALFLTEKEENILRNIVQNIETEYHSNIDKFSQLIITSHIETLLNYSDRFYQRQFLTGKKVNYAILDRVENMIDQYFEDNSKIGLPSVNGIAEQLNLSPSYLSNILKSLTGQTTQQIIHERVIEHAKLQLSSTNYSISEIAFHLGFEHSQSFSKLFKNKTNQSPLEFRESFN